VRRYFHSIGVRRFKVGELITIGITAFNAALTIERAVCSALAQTWRPIEILVRDDFSSDATFEILASLAAKHQEIRLLRSNTNQGVAAARNKILAEARGEFIAFFDDDDESLPERVAVQRKRILDYEREFAKGAPVICHTARVQLYPDGSQRVAPTMGEREGKPAPSGLPVAERTLLGKQLKYAYGACATCSQMARLSTYELVGGFDALLRRHSDTDLNIRLAMAGAHFVGIARPLVVQNMTKASEKTLAEEYRYTLALMNKHREVMDRVGQYEFCLRWVHAKQAWLEGRLGRFARTVASLALCYPGLTAYRLALAIPNLRLNRAFSRFHLRGGAA
jgi:glycosyltransferase involved in cell wall biosynthesis